MSANSALGWFPRLTLAAFMVPILFGLIGTWLPAFGWLPAIGANHWSIQPWQDLFQHPSVSSALVSTIFSGFLSSLISFWLALFLTSQLYHSQGWKWLKRSLSFLLSIPHASFAIGFIFLIAPSGWLVRLFSPELSGFDIPPNWLIVKDPWAISLTLVLILKETPFLLLMTLSALSSLDVERTLVLGRSLGYSKTQVWHRLLIPQLYPALRLPLFAVLAYALSVVELGLIIGPTAPPTFAVLVNRWFNDPDTTFRLLGAAGATLTFLLVAFSILILLLIEKGLKLGYPLWICRGKRRTDQPLFNTLAQWLNWFLLLVSLLSVLMLFLWSLAQSWRFPATWPTDWSLRFWRRGLEQMGSPFWITVITGLVATIVAIVLVLGCLENEQRLKQLGKPAKTQQIIWLIYLPLLIPQIAFLFGVQISLISLHAEGIWITLVWSHLMFVLPYVFLTLSGSYRQFDQRYSLIGISLSHSPWRTFTRIKLPILMKPIAFSMATGFAVSVAQYLPTLYIGAGRFSTITTETVSLASGSDRRIMAVFALMQFLIPLAIYSLALLVPYLRFRRYRAMQR